MFKLIIGLGNPGNKHLKDRHNAGFWLVDEIAKSHHCSWQEESKFYGLISKIKSPTGECYLLKPNTFMNRSGQAVSALMRFHKINPNEILVVHDELDLEPGNARLKWAGGLGGHDGLKDITAQLGTQDYWRLRLGIGHPRRATDASKHMEVADFVLSAPNQDQQIEIERAIGVFVHVLPKIFAGHIQLATQELHSNT